MGPAFALKVVPMDKVDTAEPELLAMYSGLAHLCPMLAAFFAVPALPGPSCHDPGEQTVCIIYYNKIISGG